MIRRYIESDIDRMVKIWLEASLIAHPFIESSYWIQQTDSMRKVYLPSSENFVYIDDESNELNGFISMVDNYLAALFVAPDKQRKGIGKQLLDKVKSGHEVITLAVYSQNEKAIRFYKREGFVMIEERTDANTSKKEWVMNYKRL